MRSTSSSILELEEIPAHLIIVGGSYIGVEFGQMFRRFGSQVTIVEKGDTIVGTPNLKGTHMLLAVGRKANTDTLNLEATGVSMNKRGYIDVDEYLQTNVPGIYALGDCNGKGAFTHTAYNHYLEATASSSSSFSSVGSITRQMERVIVFMIGNLP